MPCAPAAASTWQPAHFDWKSFWPFPWSRGDAETALPPVPQPARSDGGEPEEREARRTQAGGALPVVPSLETASSRVG